MVEGKVNEDKVTIREVSLKSYIGSQLSEGTELKNILKLDNLGRELKLEGSNYKLSAEAKQSYDSYVGLISQGMNPYEAFVKVFY